MKTAIITGGSVGIGREAAALFLGSGFEVYNLSRRPCPIEAVHSISCDLSDPASIAEACSILAGPCEDSESVALVYNASGLWSLKPSNSTELVAAPRIRQICT